MKKKPVSTRVKPRENTPLLFLLLILIPLFGGYYNFSVLLSGAVLVLLLLHTARRSGGLTLPTGPEAWCLYALCLAALAAVPFALSPGMAFSGFLRTAVWVLFFLYAATYSGRERQAILDTVAYEGAILSLLTILLFLYDAIAGVPDANGRIDGPFQYANTWSLFLLVCLILLAGKQARSKWDYPAMATLLAGVYLSGSRGTFLLLLPLALGYGVWYGATKRRWLPLALGCVGVAAVGVLAVLLSGGMVLERLSAITLSSSSLNGRLLYYLDGLRMIAYHPLGVGRGGYLYLQPLYQTGVYTLKFIHNEYLQAALDGGVLSGFLTLALMACLFFRRGASGRERAVVFAVAAHAMIDFDFQFTAVVLLLLLCGSGGRTRRVPVPQKAPAALAGAALTLMFGFFSAIYLLDFAGQPAAAYTLFPADLALAENKLQSCAGVDDAQPVAEHILSITDTSMLAWDCRFAAAAQAADAHGMVRAKFQYLRLNPYRGEVYQDFTALVEESSASCSPAELDEYQTLAQAVIHQIEEVNRNTSPLAWRIADQPDLDFIADVTPRLQAIIERG